MNQRWMALLSSVLVASAALVPFNGVSGPPSRAASDRPVSGASASGTPAPGAIIVRVQTPRYQLDAAGLRVPGYDTHSVPGAPALPVYNTLVELPADGDWRLSVQLTGTQLLTARVDIPAAPGAAPAPIGPAGWSGAEQLPDVVPTVVQPDPAIYRVNAFYPASPVQTGDVQMQRGRRFLPVRVFPFQYNPLTRQLRYQPDVLVTVMMLAAPPHPLAPSPEIEQQISGEGEPFPTPENRFLFSGEGPGVRRVEQLPSVRLHTTARGLYHLTYTDLISAGVPITEVMPATLALTYLGQPIDSQVTDQNGNGQFDAGDEIIFYAEPYQGRYMTRNVYWLTYGGTAGARMNNRGVAPTGSEPLVTTITQTLHIEYDRDYRSLYQRPDDADHWFDTQLDVSSLTGVFTKSVTYPLNLDDPITATGSIGLRAVLHGGQADVTRNPDQAVSVRVNNHVVGIYQWEGSTDTTVTASVPATWLDAVTNTLTLQAAVSQLPGITTYWVSPDWVEVSYPARAKTQNDRQYIEGVTPGRNDLAVSGFTTGTVAAYDVRDPRHPVIITSTQTQSVSGTTTVHVWDADLPAPAYFLSTPAALMTPAAIELDTPSTWRSPANAYDYIAIVPRALWDPIDPLLAYRAAEGLRVAKVDVQDIYDEFSAGRIDPQAIRDFLTYAYHNWSVTTQPSHRTAHTQWVQVLRGTKQSPSVGPEIAAHARREAPVGRLASQKALAMTQGGQPPQYVLLVGDGHYDYTGVSGVPLPNLIPPYLVYVDPWLGETAADNRYVSVDGPDDTLPDMAIGRLPANTITDVAAIVSKTLAYEAAPSADWQRRVVYVADNCADAAGDFQAFSDEVRLNWLPPVYTTTTIYYGDPVACPAASYNTGSAMHTAITSAFNNGALMVQWFGHGSRFRWGSVSGMFNIFDPPNLAANTVWPFSLSYSCWSGYFINLFKVTNPTWYQSLGETLLATPGRGSVADLSPSGLHIGGALAFLNQGMTKAVFQDRIDRVGLAVTAGKLYYYTHAGSYYDVIDTSILFGDPALRLPTYATHLSPPAAALSGDPGTVVTYTLHVTNAAYLTDTLWLTATGQVWPTSLSTHVITLAGGLSADFVVSVTVSSLAAGSSDSVRVIVAPQGSTLQAVAVLTTTVNAATQFAMQAQPVQQSGDPGTSVAYAVQVTNTGSLTDTIAFATSGHGRPAAVAPSNVWLPPYSITQVIVSTTIPLAALAGVRDVISVTATSQGGALAQSVALTTTTNARYGVGVSPGAALQAGRPGAWVTYTLHVTNAGNITDSFAISHGGSLWPVSVPAAITALPAGTAANLAVTVTLPVSRQTLSETVVITAASQASSAQFAAVQLTTTVWPYHTFLPVVRK